MLWATTMMGCAGSGLNWYWAPLYYAGYFSEMGPLSSFMEGIDFESTKYISNEYKLWPLESFQMRDDNKTLGMGWVHDRTHYWYSALTADQTLNTCLSASELDYINVTDDDIVQTYSGYLYDNIAINGLKSSFWKQKYYYFSWYRTSGDPELTGSPYYWQSSVQGTNWLGEIRLNTPVISEAHYDWAYKLNYIVSNDKSGENDYETINDIMPVLQKDSITISPNPNKGKFVIETNLYHTKLVIRDIQGKILYSRKTEGQKYFEISLRDFSDGIYFLTLYSPTRIYHQRLIITK